MKKQIIHSKSVFYSWLFSYFVIIFLCLLITMIVYAQAESIVKIEINRANGLILKQICQSIDGRLSDVESLSHQISSNRNLQSLYYTKDPLTNDDRYMEKNIVDDFSIMKDANSFVDNFYVYFNDFDSLPAADGTYDKDILYSLLFQNSDLSYAQWDQLQNRTYTGDFIPLYQNGQIGQKKIVYLKSLLMNDKEHIVTLGILFDESKLFDAIKDLNIENKSTILILDQQNHIISLTGNASFSRITYSSLNTTRNVSIQDRGKMIVSYIDSGKTDWKYVVLIPSDVYKEKIRYIQWITYTSALLCLLMGSFIAYIFARRHYNPVREITSFVAKMQANGNKSDTSNEFHMISSFIRNTLDEKNEYYKGWEKHKEWLRTNFLLRLLKGEINGKAELKEIPETYDIRFASDYFAVLLFEIDDYSRLFEEQNYEAFNMAKYAISNVAQEIGNYRNISYMVDCGDLVACLVNLKPKPSDMSEEIYHIATECKAFYEEKLELYLTISASSVHKGVSEIQMAYQEALMALEFRLVVGSDKVIRFEETVSVQCKFTYSLETENNLFNSIRVGDSKQANVLLDRIFEVNFANRNISPDMARCVIISVINTIMRAINESGFSDGSFKNLLDSLNRILNLETVSNMKSEISGLIDQICRQMECYKSKARNEKLIQNVLQYIEQHYMNMDLNVTGVAEAFRINHIFLSRLFKQSEGDTLLDYINKVRVGKAQELLKTTQINIGEISERVGYSNPNTFIRIFKKHEGITPGKYKESFGCTIESQD